MSSSHVVVIDPRVKRVTVKVTPSRFLSDILKEACTKLGLEAGQYTLKHSKKQLDLSCPIRLSGLPSGAKLELVQISQSPSPVSVALQIPDNLVSDASKARLTNKFSSTTSIWIILRRFESENQSLNFTARGFTVGGITERLLYQAPVVQAMGRELSSFTDMQMTLRDLGYNSGSILLRLSFKPTAKPFEEAMLEISQYFKDIENTGVASGSLPEDAASSSSTANAAMSQGNNGKDVVLDTRAEKTHDGEASETGQLDEQSSNLEELGVSADEPVVGPGQRPVLIYAPSSNSTPQAATYDFNAADYEPTIDHAKLHQARLSSTAQNRRLLSDAELAAKQRATSERLAKVTDIDVKIRYPDEMQVVRRFSSTDSAASLYDFASSTLKHRDEPFSLSFKSSKGPNMTVPRDANVILVKDLGFEGRMLITLAWDEGASTQARNDGALKDEYAEMAKEIKVQEIQAVQVAEEQEKRGGKGKERATGGEQKKGMPKWFKLPGRK
ncbi:hypothetical protein FGG08_003372 [Glutinoglossum americanum]|uniref:UBX domain-containing protein n=1 Tax=Glutinoglossum americanum TaxID=1670608 RepID=A0A9P8L4U8_9PEZI|nr:hypothetical protein FGG08_003372 [Glutinoglossum americanum]